MPQAEITLQEGIQAVKGGNFERARRLFNLVVEEDPDSEQGWYWLGLIAPDQDKRVACFLRALEINPANQDARDRLVRLGVPLPEGLDQAGTDGELLSADEEETGPLPPRPLNSGFEPKTQPRKIPAVFEPLDDEDEEGGETEAGLPGIFAQEGSSPEADLSAEITYQDDDLQSPLEDEDVLEPGQAQRSSMIGRLLPVLVILVLVACASLVFLSTRSGGLPFGLALAQPSPTPDPTATRPPPTATHTRTPQPTSTNTPVPPTSTPMPTLSALDSLIRLESQVREASALTQSGQVTEAIQAWDQVVEAAPDTAEAYYARGRGYYTLATQYEQENTHEMLQNALDDLDQAILTGPARGVYYLARYEINDALAQRESFREKRAPLLEQMLTDVRTAANFSLTTPFGDPNPGDVLVKLGRCQEAMAYFGQQVADNPQGVPAARLDEELARTYLCYGQLRGASLYINMAISLEPTPERQWEQAIVLYNLGRYNETLSVLDDILEANPDSPGNRYYLRALVHFERREYDQAQADLDQGSRHTSEQAQLAAYVAGLLARQSGDQAGATALFNLAEETLSPEYGLILDRVLEELGLPRPERGIPVLPDAIVRFQNNPPETIQIAAPLSEPGEFLLPARYDGSGPFHLAPAEALNLYLYPPVPVDILFVDSLTLRIASQAGADFSNVQGFLWDFRQGVWSPIGLNSGENPVSEPSPFVSPQGDIYLRIQNASGQTLAVDNLNLTLAIAGQQETGQP